MCGLLGFASTETLKGRSLKAAFFNTGFPMIAADRGMDSSGLALVNSVDRPPLVYKRTLDGADFVKSRPVIRALADIDKFPVAIGHVRSATTARGDVTDWNAHPFQYDHITLVHNGHIRNANELPNARDADSFVDSAMAAHSMAKNGEKETLEAVEGGFVFVWWNSQTKKLNIARNTERPLFFAYIERENTMFWASEITHLSHLLRNTDVDTKIGGYLHPEPQVWYQYDLKDLRKYEKVPFVSGQGRQKKNQFGGGQGGQNNFGHSSGGWTDEEIAKWGELSDTVENLTESEKAQIIATSAREEGESELDSIRDTLRLQRRGDAKKSGTPTSKKRMERAKGELSKLGILFGDLRVCVPTTWHSYKNQRGLRGSMMAKMRRGGHLVEILDVNVQDFAKHRNNQMVVVKCVNVRHGPQGHFHVVATISEKNEGFLKLKANQERISTQKALGSIERAYTGPGGQMITRARFLELSVQGCIRCAETLIPDDHEVISWIGTPPAPICEECNKPETLAALGLPYASQLAH